MGRIEKTVFISYRRTDESWGLAIFQDLTQHGYDVFIDYDGIASGNFEAVILENIRARAHFLVLLTPTALERCSDPKDWMRREIEAALDSQRNIVPLMLAGFSFGTPAIASQLTGKLAALKDYNGIEIPKARFFSSEMERLRNRFLNVRVDAILHPASDSAQQVAKEQKDKATVALGDEQRKPADVQAIKNVREVVDAETKVRTRAEIARIGLILLIGGSLLFIVAEVLIWVRGEEGGAGALGGPGLLAIFASVICFGISIVLRLVDDLTSRFGRNKKRPKESQTRE
jgi:TIR domain